MISPPVALVIHIHLADKDVEAWGKWVMAEWKAPELCEHRMARELVVSQSPAWAFVLPSGVKVFPTWRRNQKTHLLRNERTAILFRICQDRLSDPVCSVTQG